MAFFGSNAGMEASAPLVNAMASPTSCAGGRDEHGPSGPRAARPGPTRPAGRTGPSSGGPHFSKF